MRQTLALTPIESDFEHDEEHSTAEFDLFWKELMPEGTWKHPSKGFTLKVDKARMDKWAANFEEQQKRQIEVFVPYGHTYSSKENAGFVQDVAVREEGGKHSFHVLMNIPKKADSESIGKTIRGVSAGINPNVKHSTDRGTIEELGECIEHVALTPVPVITGMQDFIACGSEEPVSVMHMDLVEDGDLSEEEKLKPEFSQVQWDELKCELAEAVIAKLPRPVKQVVIEPSKGDQSMSVTPEQLRALELKFSLTENSLTEENWFEEVNKFEVPEVKEPPESKEFDIKTDPEFQKLSTQHETLVLSNNHRRHGEIDRRLKAASKSGRINKAVLDKMTGGDEKLEFSAEKGVGEEFDTWATQVEMQLDLVEALPENGAVSTERLTGGHTSNVLDQISEDEELELERETDEAIMSAYPQYHMDNLTVNPVSGLFEGKSG